MFHSLKGLNAYQLKLLGLVLMVGDHVHYFFEEMGAPILLTYLGRIVAPIFIFLSAEGFQYTHNKYKYAERLLVGSFIMFIGIELVKRLFPTEMPVNANIFASLFVGIWYMYFIDLLISTIKMSKKEWGKLILIVLALVVPFIIDGIKLTLINGYPDQKLLFLILQFIPSPILMEGGLLFLMLALWFYFTRTERWVQLTGLIFLGLLLLYRTYSMGQSIWTEDYQWMMLFAAIPLAFYNGERGAGHKYLFYIFYPTHIWTLYILYYFIVTHFKLTVSA